MPRKNHPNIVQLSYERQQLSDKGGYIIFVYSSNYPKSGGHGNVGSISCIDGKFEINMPTNTGRVVEVTEAKNTAEAKKRFSVMYSTYLHQYEYHLEDVFWDYKRKVFEVNI